jgi:hypothetical protein
MLGALVGAIAGAALGAYAQKRCRLCLFRVDA